MTLESVRVALADARAGLVAAEAAGDFRCAAGWAEAIVHWERELGRLASLGEL